MNFSFLLLACFVDLCMKHVEKHETSSQRFSFVRDASSATSVNAMKTESDLEKTEKSGDIKKISVKVFLCKSKFWYELLNVFIDYAKNGMLT